MTDPTAQPYSALGRVDAETFHPNYDRPVRRPGDGLGPFQSGDRIDSGSLTGAIPTWDDPTVVTGQPAGWQHVLPPYVPAAHPSRYTPVSPAGTAWADAAQLEYARDLRRHRRRRPGTVPIVLCLLASLLGGLLVVGVIMYSRDRIPFMQDSGITGCRMLAAPEPSPSVKSSKASFEQSADDARKLAQFRKMFADSRYADLREAGTKLIDITAQVVADPDSALLAIGAFYGAYASLSGACGAHGVPLPPISS